MTRWLAILSGALTLLLIGIGGASAAPAGSYRQSCHHIRERGPILSAECRRVDGRWNRTSLDLRRCAGPVSNENGNLTCRSSHRGWEHDRRDHRRDRDWRDHDRRREALPGGSYLKSCRDVSRRGDRLVATCRTTRGDYRRTELDLDRCRGGVANINGRLVCGR